MLSDGAGLSPTSQQCGICLCPLFKAELIDCPTGQALKQSHFPSQ